MDAEAMAMTMTTFPAKLAAALAKAQRAMAPAVLDRENPHFRSRYATLASVVAALREPLGSNGLCYVQRVSVLEAGVSIETTLAHESGESVSSVTVLPVQQRTAQGIGGTITYARRYSLSALCGVVADDDDDGEAAVGRPPNAPPPTKAMPAPGDLAGQLRASLAAQQAQQAAVPAEMPASSEPDEVEQCAVLIGEAAEARHLDALVPRLESLKRAHSPEFARLRAAWGARREVLRAGDGAPP